MKVYVTDLAIYMLKALKWLSVGQTILQCSGRMINVEFNIENIFPGFPKD
jgi:DUF1009 family protein